MAAGERADWEGYRALLDKVEGLEVVDVPLYRCMIARDAIYNRPEPCGTLVTNCVRCHGGLQRNTPSDIKVRSFPESVLEALETASSA